MRPDRPVLSILAAAIPVAAWAHPGPHGALEQAEALWHTLTQPDHLLILLAIVGLPVGGMLWARARRRGR